MSKKVRREFKGLWIPREIWETPKLGVVEKTFFGEIFALDGEDGCFASNEHFCKMFGVKERQVRNYIKKLKDLGLITVEIDKNKDRRTIRAVGRYRHISAAEVKSLNFMRSESAKKMKGDVDY